MAQKRDPSTLWFSDFLRRQMDLRGWSTYDVARALQRSGLDIDQSQVYRWSRGSSPKQDVMAEVLKVLGVSLVLRDVAGKDIEEVG